MSRPINHDETFVAIITPPGEGGIAALRLAGPDSLKILKKHFKPKSSQKAEPFLMRVGHFVNEDKKILDEVMAVYMPAERSYTGLMQVEIFCHGGRQTIKEILDLCIQSGARAAMPGEFTQTAFLNGRIDLARAEAVAEMIAANTESSLKASREHLLGAYSEHVEALRKKLVHIVAETEAGIDFPDEDKDAQKSSIYESLNEILEDLEVLIKSYQGGRIIKEGFNVAISGRPNAGKSSLFNKLLQSERALVTRTPGTTRDFLSESIDLDGFAINLTDTAGLREGGGEIERLGQLSSLKLIKNSDLVLWLVDISIRGWESKLESDLDKLLNNTIMLVYNKIDAIKNIKSLPDKALKRSIDIEPAFISCKTGKGLKSLKRMISDQIERTMPDLTSGLIVTSARHKKKLSSAIKELKSAREKNMIGETAELIAVDLRAALSELDEITGRVYTEDILGQIFAHFCIGK